MNIKDIHNKPKKLEELSVENASTEVSEQNPADNNENVNLRVE
jgi:hypothetical protein